MQQKKKRRKNNNNNNNNTVQAAWSSVSVDEGQRANKVTPQR